MVRNQAEVSGRLNNEVGSVLNRGKHVPKRKRCSRWRKRGKKIGTEAEAGRKKAEVDRKEAERCRRAAECAGKIAEGSGSQWKGQVTCRCCHGM